ncbi:exonuclease domain-containing protein [Leeia oryzae]|uniref:exonuclease domain-containing protein n=1 Tax=Leeia oryzae TaxID=356662 RepID=UPI00035FF26F|nr:exonuclease domain-containing protein [Leeia oryzae]
MTTPSYVFVDLETTGASIHKDRITEIGIVEVDADGVRQWSTLVNPGQHIPAFIQQLTGIDDDMVADAPAFEAVADEVLQRLQGKLFVAHNARFDYGFLKQSFARLGRPFRANTLCTVRLSKALYPEHYKHNLDALVARHGLIAENRHRALVDAELLWQFIQAAEKELGKEKVVEEITRMVQQPTLPEGVDADSVDALPEGVGVYRLYGENDTLLYVGKHSQIRKRVLSYFSGEHKDSRVKEMIRQIRRVAATETCGEFGAVLLEASLIKSGKPAYNPQLRATNSACSWILKPQGSGALLPVLVKANELPGKDEIRYGLFHSAKEAQAALRKLADGYRLCLIYAGLETAGKRNNSPCFNFHMKRCDGACVGKEPLSFHNARLEAAMNKLRLASWPYPGAVAIAEADASGLHTDYHVIDDWRYLGTARTLQDARQLLETAQPNFDPDICKIIQKQIRTVPPEAIHLLTEST